MFRRGFSAQPMNRARNFFVKQMRPGLENARVHIKSAHQCGCEHGPTSPCHPQRAFSPGACHPPVHAAGEDQRGHPCSRQVMHPRGRRGEPAVLQGTAGRSPQGQGSARGREQEPLGGRRVPAGWREARARPQEGGRKAVGRAPRLADPGAATAGPQAPEPPDLAAPPAPRPARLCGIVLAALRPRGPPSLTALSPRPPGSAAVRPPQPTTPRPGTPTFVFAQSAKRIFL